MNLLELCEDQATGTGVPSWVLGCFRRSSITFFSGESDRSTLVLWFQSRGLTGDLRLAADRPKVTSLDELVEQPRDVLLRLADVEGGLAPSRLEPSAGEATATRSGVMSWGEWEAFQVHPKWPEPGVLRRVGDCLIEFAPSGAYVEDWRLQAGAEGPLIGLSLLEERDRSSGELLHRGGGLVIAGKHALFVRGRATTLPPADRLAQLIEPGERGRALLEAVFSFEASYALPSAEGAWTIAASTLPWREGGVLLSLDGFSRETPGFLLQRTSENGRDIERRFRIDTLERSFVSEPETPATETARTWLAAEAATLLRAAKR